MTFENRWRGTEKEARISLLNSKSNMIGHLLDNQDNTFSIMSHIVCEYCDYCEEQGDCRGRYDMKPCIAKENSYELIDKAITEWEKELEN